MKRNKFSFILNTVLVLCILGVLLFRLFSKDVEFDCTYGKKPTELLKLIKDEFPGTFLKDVSIVFVFNLLPTNSDLETISKLGSKFKEQMTVLALFTKKFRYNNDLKFSHKFLTRLKLSCQKRPGLSDKNYFIILENNQISHTDVRFEPAEMFFLISKRLNPQLEYKDISISI